MSQTNTTASLSASASGGTVYAWRWEPTDGPSGSEIINPSAPTPTVRYSKCGIYRHALTAYSSGNPPVVKSVWVIVRPVVTSGSLYPRSATILRTETVQLSDTWLDQFGHAIDLDPVWSVSGVGEVNAIGQFTSDTAGTATVTATAGSVTASATITVT